MQERTITYGSMFASMLWVGVFALLLSGSLCGLLIDDEHQALVLMFTLCAHALALSAVAATVTIRRGLTAQNRLIVEAFELGKRSGQVRNMR